MLIPHALRAGVESRTGVAKSRELFEAASCRLALDYIIEYITICFHVFRLFFYLLVRKKRL